MQYAPLKSYLLAKPGAGLEFPFGEGAAVFKVAGKMFALVAWQETPVKISLKCDPDEAEALRAAYPAVQPGYHLNKRHWITVTLDGTIEKEEILEIIDSSYALVHDALPKAVRMELETKAGQKA